MNIKSKTYMQSGEFKERQGSFAFFCAQAFEFLVEFKDECINGWKKLFKSGNQAFENITLPLPFGAVIHAVWQRQVTQSCLKLVNG